MKAESGEGANSGFTENPPTAGHCCGYDSSYEVL